MFGVDQLLYDGAVDFLWKDHTDVFLRVRKHVLTSKISGSARKDSYPIHNICRSCNMGVKLPEF